MHAPFRAVAIACGFAALAVQPVQAQTFALEPDALHTVSVFAAGSAAGPELAEALLAQDLPGGASARLLLASQGRETVVDVITWDAGGRPQDWSPPYFPNAGAY